MNMLVTSQYLHASGGGGGENLDEVIAEQSALIEELSEILDNKAGGDSGVANDVVFYDYDGTVLHSYTLEQVQDLTELPPLPRQLGLICQGWNYDLETIKSYNRPVNVGAMYITDDGKTKLYITIEDDLRMDVPLYFSQTVADGVTIDWGDGSPIETVSSTGVVNPIHTYAAIGDYVITLDVTDEGYITLGGGNNPSVGFIGTSKDLPSKLKSIQIGKGVRSFTGYTFQNCRSLQSITIPEGIISLGTSAFSSCYALSNIVIPKSVTSIGLTAFNECLLLKSIIMPDGLTNIGEGAFAKCRSLSNIVIPKSVRSIGKKIFTSCMSLTSIVIPKGITKLGEEMFYGCSSLTSITIPDGVTSIGGSAFRSCYSLESIVIPESVSDINGYYLFDECIRLKRIVMPDHITFSRYDSVYYNCYSLQSITIPESVTDIGTYAFRSCYSLTSLTIPESVTRIGTNTFTSCVAMKFYDFTKHTSVPALSNANAFSEISSDCEIRVPAALADEWKAATNWSTYASQIVGV